MRRGGAVRRCGASRVLLSRTTVAGLGRLLLLRDRRYGRHRLGDVDPGGHFKGSRRASAVSIRFLVS